MGYSIFSQTHLHVVGHEKNGQRRMILVNLQKAFEKDINHTILLKKMHSVGFSATQLLAFLVWAVALFTSFQVSIKNKFSNVGNTNCGVAQKSRGFPCWGTSTLHKKTAFRFVNYSILKQNYRTCLKMKIASYFYCRNKLVSHKKFSKVALQTSFLRIHVFLHKKKSISLVVPKW